MEKKLKKLVSVLATSMPVSRTREEVVETFKIAKTAEAIETAGAGKDGEESKDGEDLRSNVL